MSELKCGHGSIQPNFIKITSFPGRTMPGYARVNTLPTVFPIFDIATSPGHRLLVTIQATQEDADKECDALNEVGISDGPARYQWERWGVMGKDAYIKLVEDNGTTEEHF